MKTTIAENLARLNIVLGPIAKPIASYIPFCTSGNVVIISGQLPSRDGKLQYLGAIPTVVSLEDAQAAARLAAINCVAILFEACRRDWANLRRVLKLGVFVNCTAEFQQQSQVANGASDLLAEIFGEQGKHARAAVGVSSLPLGATVEVEMMAEIATLPHSGH
ncbi:MAG: RidA family protein [Phycisphaerales bacterium]|nr:RidA family protein [Phycisphaerales bacterium]